MKKYYNLYIFTFMHWISNMDKKNPNCGFGTMFKNMELLKNNSDAKIDNVVVPHNALVTSQVGFAYNYGLYFSVMELYQAIIHYCRYNAKYYLPDARLENAFKEWNAHVYPRPSIKSFFVDLMKRKEY